MNKNIIIKVFTDKDIDTEIITDVKYKYIETYFKSEVKKYDYIKTFHKKDKNIYVCKHEKLSKYNEYEKFTKGKPNLR